MTSPTSFKARVGCLIYIYGEDVHIIHPLRFTSGHIPTDLLMVNWV